MKIASCLFRFAVLAAFVFQGPSLGLADETLAVPQGGQIAQPKEAGFPSPDVLVLGDSQIPFGSGPSYLRFFENLGETCEAVMGDPVYHLAKPRVAVIGVRSTSLGTWARRDRRGKAPICKVDPKWKANAGTFGTVNRTQNIYAQMGQGQNYQFCDKGKSAFEAMLAPDYYAPKLLFMSFLGNASATWARSRDAALRDVRAAMSQLPEGMPCVFMTSAPPYKKNIVDQRVKAQEHLKWAFKETGGRCEFVAGLTYKTIAANQGNRKHFRQRRSGKVKDPFHPNQMASKIFFALQRPSICAAVNRALRGTGKRMVARSEAVDLGRAGK